jgi:adenylate kinase
MEYLRDLARLATDRGNPIEIFDVRDAMFEIARDVGEPVEEETILDMYPRALVLLRATALERIASICEQASRYPNWIVNTHAVFRWKNTLISGFDPYYLNRLRPDVYLTVTSGVLTVRERLREHPRWPGWRPRSRTCWCGARRSSSRPRRWPAPSASRST